MEDETNLADAPEVEEVLELEDGSTEIEAEANPDEEAEPAEPETVEIERDGKTFKVPAELKDDFLRQADYTRKTQEIAEVRKSLTATVERVQEVSEAEVSARARVVALESALGQYEGVNWSALQAQDPNGAMQHWMTYSQLQTALGDAKNEHQSAQEARSVELQQLTAKQIDEGSAILQRDIPGWGPQKAEELMAFGASKFGLTREYMESVTDPILVKLLHALKDGSKQPKPVQPVQPAAKVRGGVTPRKDLDDRLSPDDWLKARNAQLAKQRG